MAIKILIVKEDRGNRKKKILDQEKNHLISFCDSKLRMPRCWSSCSSSSSSSRSYDSRAAKKYFENDKYDDAVNRRKHNKYRHDERSKESCSQGRKYCKKASQSCAEKSCSRKNRRHYSRSQGHKKQYSAGKEQSQCCYVHDSHHSRHIYKNRKHKKQSCSYKKKSHSRKSCSKASYSQKNARRRNKDFAKKKLSHKRRNHESCERKYKEESCKACHKKKCQKCRKCHACHKRHRRN